MKSYQRLVVDLATVFGGGGGLRPCPCGGRVILRGMTTTTTTTTRTRTSNNNPRISHAPTITDNLGQQQPPKVYSKQQRFPTITLTKTPTNVTATAALWNVNNVLGCKCGRPAPRPQPQPQRLLQSSFSCSSSLASFCSWTQSSQRKYGQQIRLSRTQLSWSSSFSFHTLAIAREIPNSFERALSQHYDNNDKRNHNNDDDQEQQQQQTLSSSFDLDLARQQHAAYIQALRRCLPTLLLPADEAHPDSPFCEDIILTGLGGSSRTTQEQQHTALLTQPGHATRRGEVETLRVVLERQLGMTVHSMKELNPHAFCDGGDVLNTGRHVFVGISDRTNEEALQVMEHVFWNKNIDDNNEQRIPLIPVVLKQSKDDNSSSSWFVLHLKSAITHVDEYTLLAPDTAWADDLLQAMKVQELGYVVIRLPSILACNAVVIQTSSTAAVVARGDGGGGSGCSDADEKKWPTTTTVLVQDSSCSITRDRLHHALVEERHFNVELVHTSEWAKKDAAPTCCSVLLRL